jgi:hypothetical protein
MKPNKTVARFLKDLDRREEKRKEDTTPHFFTHDCDKCKALGIFEKYDLYICDKQGGNLVTVIARYGNKPWEYFSGLGLLHSTSGPLYVARQRAIAKGYLPA